MTKPFLFLVQIDIEGPSRLVEQLERCGIPWEQRNLYAGDAVPENPRSYAAIIPMGGPMNVYEEDTYPFLKEEDCLLKQALEAEVPILGLCLGCQLLAKAAGAKVVRNPLPEIGWMKVQLTEQGVNDPLFQGLDADLSVFQWHGDTVELPANGVWLASSERCRHQAFRIGRAAYGLQFHVEVAPDDVHAWTEAYLSDLRRQDDGTIERHLREDGHLYDSDLEASTAKLMDNFIRLTGTDV